jgi:fermentation-respiration switch protein FrsA (DUF1100 family)
MRKKGWRYWFNLGAFGLVVFSAVIIVSIAAASYKTTSRYLHPQRHNQSDKETPDLYGIAYEEIRLVTVDGIELEAWYTPPENGALILIAHGYGDRRSVEQYVLYAQNGYGVLAWDFRAHGESGGEMSTLGYHEALDVEAALDFGLRQADVEHIGAWGGSMGGVAVLEAASRRAEIEAVVVDSAFPTLEDELRWAVSSSVFLPFIRFFAERETGVDLDMFRPIDRIGEISPRPVMIIQGEEDSMIPVDSAHRLYEAAGDPRYLWTEAGVNHVGMYYAHPEKYEEWVVGFFDDYLLQRSE